ncbi:hypothetical protein [Moorena sp. SIO3F7]|uniref:hypothetical protein n=1 Tax=Moorena sp. SIO3F7 TaxID=2607839 RepID=UPI0013FF95ED|nr:hypothetical protein [Moorena sp. SIO3F7]NEQ03768.1 hypothetical protein [Moorena sp. SIO3F7]
MANSISFDIFSAPSPDHGGAPVPSSLNLQMDGALLVSGADLIDFQNARAFAAEPVEHQGLALCGKDGLLV